MTKTCEKVFSMIAVLSLMMAFASHAFAYQTTGLYNFSVVNTYTSNTFADISDAAWYSKNVEGVYRYGIMTGISSNQFAPGGNVTLAQVITMAARIHNIYSGGTGEFIEFGDNSTWYDAYKNYAVEVGVLTQSFSDYNAPATRAEFAKILAASIDSVDLEAINIVDDKAIPDVPMSADYADAVYLLYRAGVITGSDEVGTFNPTSTITRAEAAAIITRMVDPSLRKSIELVGEY